MINVNSKYLVLFPITIFSVFADFSPDWRSGEDGRVNWAHNCDFNGNNIGRVRSTGEACGGLCYQKADCKQFKWTNDDGGICHFKDGNGKAFYDDNGVCGYVTAERTVEVNI